jgi:NADH-quinone oxidoreductase subunit M
MTIYLSILIWLPLAGAVLGLLLPRALTRWTSLGSAVLALAYAIVALARFDSHKGLQFVTDDVWIRELGIHWRLGIDGLNLFLVLLTTIVWVATVLWAGRGGYARPRAFFFLLMLGESGVLGALTAQDLALFVLFFDLMLVPFYFLGGAWSVRGGWAAITKLFIYTLVGSLLMLAAAIATGVLAAKGGHVDFSLATLAHRHLHRGTQEWIFLCFAAAFLVKMPAFPLHGWMPDGYRAMPLPVLGVFSAVLSKVAAYGFLRIVLPLFPAASVHFQTLMLLIALASILYGSALAFTTTNVRLVLGYSSVAQLGFITLGIFSLRDAGAQGALLQAFNHGLVVMPAFFIVALLAARSGGSEDLRDMGGIAFRAPVLAAMFLVVSFATLAMPGTSNFVGEFYILLGTFQSKVAIAVVAFVGVAAAAVYMLRAFIRSMHNRVGPQVSSREMSLADGLVLVPLVALIVAIALYPQIALHRSERSTKAAIALVGGRP